MLFTRGYLANKIWSLTKPVACRPVFEMTTFSLRCFVLLCAVCSSCCFVLTPIRSSSQIVAASSNALLAESKSVNVAAARVSVPQMGLFGLGTPELMVIAGVALLILGPEQVKKLAKDVGKVTSELKQVPEEFSKGMEAGALEAEKKKMTEAEKSPKSLESSSETDTKA